MRAVHVVAACVLAAVPGSVAAAQKPGRAHGILLVEGVWDGARHRLAGAAILRSARPLRPQRAPGPALRFEALDARGRVLGSGEVPDPRVLLAPLDGGGTHVVSTRREADWAVRLPHDPRAVAIAIALDGVPGTDAPPVPRAVMPLPGRAR